LKPRIIQKGLQRRKMGKGELDTRFKAKVKRLNRQREKLLKLGINQKKII